MPVIKKRSMRLSPSFGKQLMASWTCEQRINPKIINVLPYNFKESNIRPDASFTRKTNDEAEANSDSLRDGEVRKLLYVMRSVGGMPIVKTEKGWKFSVGYLVYSAIFYATMIPIYVVVFSQDLMYVDDVTKSTAFNFNRRIYFELIASSLIPYCLMPFCSWLDASNTARFLNSVANFQRLFMSVAKRPLNPPVRLPIVAILAPSCVAVAVFRVIPPYLATWKISAILVNMLYSGSGLLYWMITCHSLKRASQQIADCLKIEIKAGNCSSQLLSDYKTLWLSLSKLTVEYGNSVYKSFLVPLAGTVLSITLSVYGLISTLADSGDNMMNYAVLYSLITLMTNMPLYAMCNEGYHVSMKLKNDMLKVLHHLDFTLADNVSPQRQQLNSFIKAIQNNPPIITMGGFITMDRKLYQSAISTIVTYLIVLLQFRSGLQAPVDSNATFNNNTF